MLTFCSRISYFPKERMLFLVIHLIYLNITVHQIMSLPFPDIIFLCARSSHLLPLEIRVSVGFILIKPANDKKIKQANMCMKKRVDKSWRHVYACHLSSLSPSWCTGPCASLFMTYKHVCLC